MMAMTQPARKNRRKNWPIGRVRLWTQVGFAVVFLTPWVAAAGRVCGPVFHCYSCPLASFLCPLGLIASFSALHLFPFMAVGTLVLVGAAFGSMVCGWACPFGFLQDLIGRVPTPKFHLPPWTGYTRYVVLAGLVIAIPYFFGEGSPLFFCRLCPAGTLEAALPNAAAQVLTGAPVTGPGAVKLVILVLLAAAMFIKRRPWCRLFCPLGGVFALFNRFSLVHLRFDPHGCNECDMCRTRCPYGVYLDRSPNTLNCIRCLECTSCDAIAWHLWGRPGVLGTPAPGTAVSSSTRQGSDDVARAKPTSAAQD